MPLNKGGAANNVVRKAVLAQHFIAKTATAGVGAPIVVDEADAAVVHHPRCIDNMEVINGINCTNLQSMAMIREAIRARGAAAAVTGRIGGAAVADCKLELLLKRCKLEIEVDEQMLIAHCEQMIRMLEEKETREMEGGS